jgi:membrane protein DedA with SNARE-associated domain
MQVDHFHPGSKVARATVCSPTCKTSTLPLSNGLTSAGALKFFLSIFDAVAGIAYLLGEYFGELIGDHRAEIRYIRQPAM